MTDMHSETTAPSGGAASAGAQPVNAPAREPVPADWRDDLPPVLRRVAEKFATPADALHSYAALEKRLGRSVTIPAQDAPPGEIAAFHARLGRPDDPAGYAVALPVLPDHPAPGQADAERFQGFLAAMHAAGAAPPVVQAAVDWYAGAAAEIARAEQAGRAEAQEEAGAALRREWGEGFDRKLTLARRAARHFGGNELARTLDETGLGDHPAWLRAFARIGEEMAEGSLVSGAGADAGRDVQSRIDALVAAHFGKPSYQSAAVQRELRTLYRALYGTGAAGSGAG